MRTNRVIRIRPDLESFQSVNDTRQCQRDFQCPRVVASIVVVSRISSCFRPSQFNSSSNCTLAPLKFSEHAPGSGRYTRALTVRTQETGKPRSDAEYAHNAVVRRRRAAASEINAAERKKENVEKGKKDLASRVLINNETDSDNQDRR